ncbi:Rab3 GTPase-activating protein catalytic subunit [Irineochytrium annulatum]|nr:Rab3 GTPase-activating protein catalytic subunit [Irineochytrium annulatum]
MEAPGPAGSDEEEAANEVFEIIDYTSASSWERFISAIESLVISWGIDEGGLGAFHPKEVAQSHGYSQQFVKKDLIMFGDQSYILSYHYLPLPDKSPFLRDDGLADGRADAWRTEGTNLSFFEFIPLEGTRRYSLSGAPRRHSLELLSPVSPTELRGEAWGKTDKKKTGHPLHRWTGRSHFLLLSPFSVTDMFESEGSPSSHTAWNAWNSSSATPFDSNLVKLLISSFAIACQNTGCCVPAFVPNGPPWRNLFSGYMLSLGRGVDGTAFSTQKNVNAEDVPMVDVESLLDQYALDVSEIQFRFKMMHMPFVPPAYIGCEGLKSLFEQKLRESMLKGFSSEDPPLSFDMTCAAEYTYVYENFHDPKWRHLHTHATKSISTRGKLTAGLLYDPLSTIVLKRYFPRADVENFTDDANVTDIDATSPNLFKVDVEFIAPTSPNWQRSHFPIMAGILQHLIGDWTDFMQQDQSEEALDAQPADRDEGAKEAPQLPLDDGNLNVRVPTYLETKGGDFSETSLSAVGLGKRVVRSAVLTAMGAGEASHSASVGIVDPADISMAIQTLFVPQNAEPPVAVKMDKIKRPPPVQALYNQMKGGTTVPISSFLWNFALLLMDAVSPTSSLNFQSPLGSYIKAVWTNILKQLRIHWEYGVLVPRVAVTDKNPSIDLRSALINQKFNMLNCCILRKMKIKARAGGESLSDMEKSSGIFTNASDNNVLRATDEMSQQMPSLSNRLLSTLSTLATVAAEEVAGVASFVTEPLPTNQNGTQSPGLIEKLFDRLTGGETNGHNNLEGLTVPRAERGVDIKSSSTHPNLDPMPAASWNSDLSWEDFHMQKSDKAGQDSLRLSAGFLSNGEDGEDDDGDEGDDDATGDIESNHNSIQTSDSELFFDSVEAPSSRSNPFGSGKRRKNRKRDSNRGRSPTLNDFVKNTPSPQPQPPRHLSMMESFVQLEPEMVPLSNAAASTLLEGIEKVITESGAGASEWNAGNRSDDEDQWSSLEVKGENEAEGYLNTPAGMVLLRTGEPMRIPEVQEPGFMTEDMIFEQERIFEQLGCSDEAGKIRAKIQGRHLQSDMSSFKAANPHATIEDFVRWHSPRDWIEGENGQEGRMSSRMQEPNNLWQEIWRLARRIPASRQKPLFDHEKEAEKVFHYFETLTPFQILSSLLPTFFLIAYDRLANHEVVSKLPTLASEISKLGSRIVNTPWKAVSVNRQGPLHELIVFMESAERRVGQAVCLLQKFPMQYKLVEMLLIYGESTLQDAVERETVLELFTDDTGELNPKSREFIFRAVSRCPLAAARQLPQRMYALLQDGEFRVLTTLAMDAAYI